MIRKCIANRESFAVGKSGCLGWLTGKCGGPRLAIVLQVAAPEEGVFAVRRDIPIDAGDIGVVLAGIV